MIKKILIANRGEIAVRIMRAARELGIKTVAVYSTADKDSMHVKHADEAVCIGPAPSPQSYLNMRALMTTALLTGADAIHPGYGFLSENADFAEMVEEHGLIWIGPKSETIRLMGDKVRAKEIAIKTGIPVVPGSKGAVNTLEEAKEVVKEIGLPIVVKAASGGGGRGIRLVETMDQLEEGYKAARLEGKTVFGDDTVFIERYLQNPKHIELQVFGDNHGNVVVFGERDCSTQRKKQKVIEEAPAIALTPKVREEIINRIQKAVTEIGYANAGTVEFLYENEQFYFMEMNTRLQVEHPVTEMVYDVDLVKEQIRIANGEKLGYTQKDVKATGHAIECRINAEDPETFIPSPGKINEYDAPAGQGVRVDSFLYDGYTVPSSYDSMISKLIVHGKDRNDAIKKAQDALAKFQIKGIKTNIELHKKILDRPEFKEGTKNTIHWLEKFLG